MFTYLLLTQGYRAAIYELLALVVLGGIIQFSFKDQPFWSLFCGYVGVNVLFEYIAYKNPVKYPRYHKGLKLLALLPCGKGTVIREQMNEIEGVAADNYPSYDWPVDVVITRTSFTGKRVSPTKEKEKEKQARIIKTEINPTTGKPMPLGCKDLLNILTNATKTVAEEMITPPVTAVVPLKPLVVDE